jgi:glycogen debranching enzyme
MQPKEIIEKLKKDIEMLKDKEFGYIRAGYPRFMALFGRDSIISSWQLIDYNPTIAKNTIEILAKLQGKEINIWREEEPGKILHEWHPEPEKYKPLPWPLPYYGSIDSTPLFIYLCAIYYKKTTNTEWLLNIWPNIEAALFWCEKYGDIDGDLLLEYERKNPVGLWHQGWKDSRQDHINIEPPVELVEPQGYYYAALREAEELSIALGKIQFAEKLHNQSEILKQNFINQFWMDDIKYFAFALSRSKIPDKRITSNPGHLLFTGILDGEDEKIKAVVERLFSDEMYTPYGIRTHSTLNSDFNPWSYHLGSIWPHDNWIIAQGLKRYGYIKEYQRIKEALILTFETLGEIPELYAVFDKKLEKIPIACSPQAWASGALLQFLLEDL